MVLARGHYHLKPCQRADVKFVRISGIEDDQCQDI